MNEKENEMKKSAEFLIKTLTDTDIPGNAKFKCRYNKMVNFAKIYGITDPKYIGPEEEGIIACHGFANSFAVNAFYILVPSLKVTQNGEERSLVKNPNKFLHAGNKYNWERCVDIKNGDLLTATAKISKVWLIEDSMILFAELLLNVKNQNDELVCNVTSSVAIRPGGY
ncbi:MAG: MaoC family dehydratase N-terminal domain-containing protein [Candidatus Hodarchaeota archaeon]